MSVTNWQPELNLYPGPKYLALTRALRERIDWAHVRAATAESPFARAFFVMIEGLGVLDAPADAPADAPQSGARAEPRVRVVTDAGSAAAAAG